MATDAAVTVASPSICWMNEIFVAMQRSDCIVVYTINSIQGHAWPARKHSTLPAAPLDGLRLPVDFVFDAQPNILFIFRRL